MEVLEREVEENFVQWVFPKAAQLTKLYRYFTYGARINTSIFEKYRETFRTVLKEEKTSYFGDQFSRSAANHKEKR